MSLDRPRRRALRLKGYDYAQPGGYFVTICTQGGKCLFGKVVEEEMRLNPAGVMIEQAWHALSDCFPIVELDAFVVMPNHIHGIIILLDPSLIDPNRTVQDSTVGAPLVGARDEGRTTRRAGTRPAPTIPRILSLGDVVGAFKSITTRQYISGVNTLGWAPFSKRLWQRNYWDRIIRNGKELDRIRQYIDDNPARWHWDKFNPTF